MISIIVPVYNIQEYLQRCVDSLLNQTYRDIEIILVDDGSTDTSGQLCDQLAKQDRRIRVIHKPNGGLSDARNAGIEVAKGEWLAFVDSDDWVESSFLEQLLNAAQDAAADIAICSYNLTYDHHPAQSIVINQPQQVLTQQQALEDVLTYQRYGGVMTWNKLCKRAIFDKHQLRFPKGKLHEDNFTTYQAYFYANKLVYIDQPLYNYYQRSNGIMAEQFSERRYHAVEAAQDAQQFIAHHTPELAEAAEFNLIMSYVTLLNRLHQGHACRQYRNLWREALLELSRLNRVAAANRFLRTKDKVRLKLAAWPRVYYWLDLLHSKLKK